METQKRNVPFSVFSLPTFPQSLLPTFPFPGSHLQSWSAQPCLSWKEDRFQQHPPLLQATRVLTVQSRGGGAALCRAAAGKRLAKKELIQAGDKAASNAGHWAERTDNGVC